MIGERVQDPWIVRFNCQLGDCHAGEACAHDSPYRVGTGTIGTPAGDLSLVALDNEERYLSTLLNDMRAIIKKGGTMEKAMDTAAASEKDKWVLFDIVNRRNVNNVYPSLEWE